MAGISFVDDIHSLPDRIMLHENLGEAHRKHAYQLMANELGWSIRWYRPSILSCNWPFAPA